MGCMFSCSTRSNNSRRNSLSSINDVILEENVFLLTEEHIFELTVQMTVEEHRKTIKILKCDGVQAAERFIKEILRYEVYMMFNQTFLIRTKEARRAMLEDAEAVVEFPMVPRQYLPEAERDSPEPDYSFYTESEFVSSNDIAIDAKEIDAKAAFQPHVLVENRGLFSFDPLRSTFKSMPSVRIAAVTVVPSSFISAFCLDKTYKSDSPDTEVTSNGTYLIDSDDEEKADTEQTTRYQLDDLSTKLTKRTLARSSTFKMEEFTKRADSCQFSPLSGLQKRVRQTFESTASLYVAPCRPKVSVMMCASERYIDRPVLQTLLVDSDKDTQSCKINKENQSTVEQVSSPVAPTRRYNMKMLKAKAAFNAMRETAKSMPALQDNDQLFAEMPNFSNSDRFLVQLGDPEVNQKKKTLTPSSSFKFTDLSAMPKSGAASLGALNQQQFSSETNVTRTGRSLTPSASFKMSSFVRRHD